MICKKLSVNIVDYLDRTSYLKHNFTLNFKNNIQFLIPHITWPDKHGRAFMVPCKKWFVQCRLPYTSTMDNGHVTFYKVPENTAMHNWSPWLRLGLTFSLNFSSIALKFHTQARYMSLPVDLRIQTNYRFFDLTLSLNS